MSYLDLVQCCSGTASSRSVGGRGQERGRRRGRGRGLEQAAALEDPLYQVSVERQLTQRRVAALPAAVRQELIVRKREAHLERMLLPDAPPRKRQLRSISPERQPCIMAAPRGEVNASVASTSGVPLSSELNAGVASTSGVPLYSELNAGVASTSGVPLSSELNAAVASTSGEPLSSEPCTRTVEAVIEYVGTWPGTSGAGIEVGAAEVIVAASSSSYAGPSQIGVKDDSYDGAMEEWLQLTQTCDSDEDDLNDDANDGFVQYRTGQGRDAAAEPACATDLNTFQTQVLQREDVANDLALRDILPDDCYIFDWNKDRRTFHGRRETFTGTSGPTFELTDSTRPIDVYDKILDNNFIDLLCTETNRNADQKIALLREQNKLGPHSRYNRWTPTDRDEMGSFLAIIILHGLYPLPEEEAYFSFNGFGTMPHFSRVMSYNRFLLLKTFLHFVDNQTTQDTTRLKKIRPVIDHFNDRFSSLYMPSQEIAIDESLLKWHGSLNFAQKIASKAAQVGVKTYELCESSSGYLWKFFVYAGKASSTTDTPDTQTDDRPVEDEAIDRPNNDGTDGASTDRLTGDSGDRPTNATARIVYDLIEPLLHRGHTVIMDNFYNCPLLLRSLKKQKTDCYGTLRLNREFVPDFVKTLTKTDLRQGEVVATYCSDLSILVWRAANIVSLISTYHNLQIGTQDKYNRVTYKPDIVLDYNKNMGGVDRKDQFLSAQPMERLRNRVWYKKLFRRLYNAAIFNCFVIYSSLHRRMTHRQFRIVLAEDLLKRHRQIDLTTESRRLTLTSTTGQVTTTIRHNIRHKTQARPTVDSNHFPVRTGSKATVCRMCPKKRRTIWKCEECDVNLCIEGCFKAYHKP